ncbi:uncharacterized protein LOC115876428 isoform X1 [Sitophilus oryzae]|uniref:Uncharacterized protein LOC115876428 isoform X1 n=1 Tax=Sitophilus oryzae TaxID=7048 RepID=A0A6J2XA55_SITOR|nr:uncharacterized protein LOC115876428 isoform X1 [Sitophilus oryzae]
MKWMFGLIIVLFAPSIVLSQVITCHRCFGNTYCNNASHPDFQANIRVAGCGTLLSTNNVETENEAKLRAIEKKINPGISTMIDGVYHQCITATVFEGNEAFTIRTCQTSDLPEPYLCERIRGSLVPARTTGSQFNCAQCSSDNCNTHTLQRPLGSKATGIKTWSLGLLLALIMAHLKLN